MRLRKSYQIRFQAVLGEQRYGVPADTDSLGGCTACEEIRSAALAALQHPAGVGLLRISCGADALRAQEALLASAPILNSCQLHIGAGAFSGAY